LTGATSGVAIPLQIAASAPIIFYTPADYGVQTAIAVVAAGGTGPYLYSFGSVLPANLPTVAQGLSINSASGLVTFKAAVTPKSIAYDLALAASTAADAAAAAAPTNPVLASAATTAKAALALANTAMTNAGGISGLSTVVTKKYAVPIVITDAATPMATVTVTVNMTFDDGAGSSNNANLASVPARADSASGTWTLITPTPSQITSSVIYIPGTRYTAGTVVSLPSGPLTTYYMA
jgi:hypothetical protein